MEPRADTSPEDLLWAQAGTELPNFFKLFGLESDSSMPRSNPKSPNGLDMTPEPASLTDDCDPAARHPSDSHGPQNNQEEGIFHHSPPELDSLILGSNPKRQNTGLDVEDGKEDYGHSVRDEVIGEWKIEKSCCEWEGGSVRLILNSHPTKPHQRVKLMKFENIPTLKLGEDRVNKHRPIWPYFIVEPQVQPDQLPPALSVVAYDGEVEEAPVSIKWLKEYSKFRTERPFNDVVEQERKLFRLRLRLTAAATQSFVTPVFKVLRSDSFEKTERVSSFQALRERLDNLPDNSQIKEVDKILNEAFKLWEEIGCGKDNENTDLLNGICRAAIYHNRPLDAVDELDDLETASRRKYRNNPEVFAKVCLCIGKHCRRVNLLEQAESFYQKALKALGKNDDYFEIKYDLFNSLSQVKYLRTDSRPQSLITIVEALKDDRISPELRAKLLVAKSRFLQDPMEKIQAFREAIYVRRTNELREFDSTASRLWKLENLRTDKHPVEGRSINDVIDDVNVFLEKLKTNNFEVGRLKWRLIVLHCLKRDRAAVEEMLQDIIPHLDAAKMELESAKARFLLDLLRQQPSQFRQFPYFHPNRLQRIQDHLRDLASLLVQ